MVVCNKCYLYTTIDNILVALMGLNTPFWGPKWAQNTSFTNNGSEKPVNLENNYVSNLAR